MFLRLLLAAFILGHGLIHASWLSPRPPAGAGGPAWPFTFDQSWLLGALDPGATRALGLALVALTIAAWALAALGALGIAPASLWTASVVAGSVSSIAILVLFFHPWLVLGIAIDLALLWFVLVRGWTPDALGA